MRHKFAQKFRKVSDESFSRDEMQRTTMQPRSIFPQVFDNILW